MESINNVALDLTIVIPNRNRNLKTVKKTLDALQPQLRGIAVATVVDYGSEINYQTKLALLVANYELIDIILCPTQGQLFHKTRAINIVLKRSTSTYFMVLDMDCICHPSFLNRAIELASTGNTINFPYGFLSELESDIIKDFNDYQIDFIGGLTGTAIFKTSDLINLNGFDEVYHNWGAEDADMFERLERFGTKTTLYKEKSLLLHQWHAKNYRLQESKLPYHDALETINHEYFKLSRKLKRIKANEYQNWGQDFNIRQYLELRTPSVSLNVNSTIEELKALFIQLSESKMDQTISIKINDHIEANKLKTLLKALLNRKLPNFISLERANKIVLEGMIQSHRNRPYNYKYDRNKGIIELTIGPLSPEHT